MKHTPNNPSRQIWMHVPGMLWSKSLNSELVNFMVKSQKHLSFCTTSKTNMVEFGTSFSEASLLRVLAVSFRAVLWKIRFTFQSKFHLGNFSTVSPTNWNSEPLLSDLGHIFVGIFFVEKRRNNTTKNTRGDDKILKSSDRVVSSAFLRQLLGSDEPRHMTHIGQTFFRVHPLGGWSVMVWQTVRCA